MADKEKLTPMMEQYWQIRNSLSKDIILLYRLGDFYEMFYDDAVEGSKILSITLTSRSNYPMAGIPAHASSQYIQRLLAYGKKVAICEQTEIASAGKLVNRSISRILTPGTTLEDNQLEGKHSNFIMSINLNKTLSCAWMDISTSEFYCANFENPSDFFPIFSAISPKEVLIPEEASKKWSTLMPVWYMMFRALIDLRPVTNLYDYRFDKSFAKKQLYELFKVKTLEGFGLKDDADEITSAGALLYYVKQNLCAMPENITNIKKFPINTCLFVDPATQRNLEIFKSNSGNKEGSLINILDKCLTSQGSRLLESYLSAPSIDIAEIKRRQELVYQMYIENQEASQLNDYLTLFRDIPRILSRMQNKLKNPRELLAVVQSLKQMPKIKALLKNIGGSVDELASQIGDFSVLTDFLESALNEELPNKVQDGGIFKRGFDIQLDKLKDMSKNNITWLTELELKEQEITGIKNLRVKYNGAYGYFIEVSKSQISLVPDNYIRRQTLTNVERYTTAQLKQKESEILNSNTVALQREVQLFEELIKHVLEHNDELMDSSRAIAQADLFSSWAQIALQWDYCKPNITNSNTLMIKDGRHPVVEQMLKTNNIGTTSTEAFIANDCYLDSTQEQIILLTGPNMAGKSTYIRQTALITLMAQIGSFVPASECEIGIVDRIFSRVGASDDLAKGNSTFMVEMSETANILNNATNKSLIILDEIGRGTSTYDGLSIAWAVVEYLHSNADMGPRTLFATHYHEITKLQETLSRLVNYRVCVKEWNDEIIFVRKIEAGAADKSYGIQVARLAGLPNDVIERAKEVLAELEDEGSNIIQNLGGKIIEKSKKKTKKNTNKDNFRQLSLF